jgi:hypothetical protein
MDKLTLTRQFGIQFGIFLWNLGILLSEGGLWAKTRKYWTSVPVLKDVTSGVDSGRFLSIPFFENKFQECGTK